MPEARGRLCITSTLPGRHAGETATVQGHFTRSLKREPSGTNNVRWLAVAPERHNGPKVVGEPPATASMHQYAAREAMISLADPLCTFTTASEIHATSSNTHTSATAFALP